MCQFCSLLLKRYASHSITEFGVSGARGLARYNNPEGEEADMPHLASSICAAALTVTIFGRRLAITPGFRRLARSGELLITELSPTESRGFKVVLVKLTPEEGRQLAILSSVLEDAETGRKLATVFIPSPHYS